MPASHPVLDPDRTATMCVVGAGYVGLTAAACFAALGHTVRCLEHDHAVLARLRAGEIPIHEPGLEEVVAESVAAGRLSFSSDVDEAMAGATVALLCVGTPPREDGHPDLRQLAAAARSVAAAATGDIVITVKSTVPPGTCEAVELLVADSCPPGLRATVVSNPEFLRESQAVGDFFEPDRVVIGADDERAGALVAGLYPEQWPRLRCDRRSAELVKYAANTFLALKISFANEIAGLCERLGADAVPVLAGVGMDQRIGASFLGHGPGFGGSCLGKDLTGLIATADALGYATPVAHAAHQVNRWARERVVNRLGDALGDLAGRRIAILGLAFKPGTDDTRDSPAAEIVRRILGAGATVRLYDPVARVRGWEHLQATSAYHAARGADAVVLATAWEQFALLDTDALRAEMVGTLVLDLVGSLEPGAAEASGLDLVPVGRGVPDAFHAVVIPPLEWCLDTSLR